MFNDYDVNVMNGMYRRRKFVQIVESLDFYNVIFSCISGFIGIILFYERPIHGFVSFSWMFITIFFIVSLLFVESNFK